MVAGPIPRQTAALLWLVLLAVLWGAACAPEQGIRRAGADGAAYYPVAGSVGVTRVPNLIYAVRPQGPLRLDLTLPPPPHRPAPVIVFIHGGGWTEGSRTDPAGNVMLHHDAAFARRGYAVANVDYRLSQAAKFPAQITDVRAAVRWLRGHAARFGLDPGRVGAWGESAGGHLAALLGAMGEQTPLETAPPQTPASARVQAVVDWFGPVIPSAVVSQERDHPELFMVAGRLLGHKPLDQYDPHTLRRADVTTYVDGDEPPFLIMHGDLDRLVPPAQSHALFTALRRAGVPVELVVARDMPHGLGRPQDVAKVMGFFDAHL